MKKSVKKGKLNKKLNRKIKNESFFNRNYRLSFNYLKESKNFIFAIIIAFFVFVLIGYFLPTPKSLEDQIIKLIQELMEKTKGLSMTELILFIFKNNIQSSVIGMALGIFLGIFPFFVSIANGYVLGFVAVRTVGAEGLISLWRLFPHGVFELPAIFIALGLGVKFGTFIFHKKIKESFVYYLVNSIRVLFFVILPLLILAAVIEGSLIFLIG